MKITLVSGLIAALLTMTSGCFATRMVRIETAGGQPNVVAAEPGPPPPAPVAVADTGGTLVVEAMEVPAPPPSPTLPVRLPSSVADASGPTHAAARPQWDPLPSYVAQYSGPGWSHLPVFRGGPAQSSTAFRRWAPIGGRWTPAGYGAVVTPSSTGAYGSTSPHFSSPPSYSGSVSSHFAGGSYSGSGY